MWSVLTELQFISLLLLSTCFPADVGIVVIASVLHRSSVIFWSSLFNIGLNARCCRGACRIYFYILHQKSLLFKVFLHGTLFDLHVCSRFWCTVSLEYLMLFSTNCCTSIHDYASTEYVVDDAVYRYRAVFFSFFVWTFTLTCYLDAEQQCVFVQYHKTLSDRHMRGRQKVLITNILDYNFFHNLYISETCIFHWPLWICLGYGVIVINDITGH